MRIVKKHTVSETVLNRIRNNNISSRINTSTSEPKFTCGKCGCIWHADRKDYTIVKRYKSGNTYKKDISCPCPECYTTNTIIGLTYTSATPRSLDQIVTSDDNRTYKFYAAVIGKVPMNAFDNNGNLVNDYVDKIKKASKPYSVVPINTNGTYWYEAWNAINETFIKGTVIMFYYNKDGYKTNTNMARIRVKRKNGKETLTSNNADFRQATWNIRDAPLP